MALHNRRGVYQSWANTVDRTARTQAARDARSKQFEQQVDPEGRMDPETRAKAAAAARRAHCLKMAEKSVRVRREHKEAWLREQAKNGGGAEPP